MSNYNTSALNLQLPDQALLFSGDSLYARLQELEDKRACRGCRYPGKADGPKPARCLSQVG